MTLIPVIVCKILAVKLIVLIQIFTSEAAPRRYYFLDTFKKFSKILKKTFWKRFMFVTASDFWLTTLLKLNSTIDVFPPSFTNLARAVISHNTLERLLLCYEFFLTSHPYLVLKTALAKLLGKLSKIMWKIANFYSCQVFLFKFCKNFINSRFS